MEMRQLIIGVVLAVLLLIFLGFAMIRYSAVIPLRPFFIFATVLIYGLSFKMIGVSVHALQVASVLPVHSLTRVPYIEFIGLYPAWETLISQLILVLVIVGVILFLRKNKPKQTITISN